MSKETEIDAIVAAIVDFIDQETPDVTKWNLTPSKVRELGAKIGDFFTSSDAAHAALVALFEVDHDGSTGLSDPPEEWVADAAASYSSPSVFTLAGDRRADFAIGHRVRVYISGNPLVVGLTNVVFAAGVTTCTCVPPALTPALAGNVDRALVRFSAPLVRNGDIIDRIITGVKIGLSAVKRENLEPGASSLDLLVLDPAQTLLGSVSPTFGSIGPTGSFTTRGGPISLRGVLHGNFIVQAGYNGSVLAGVTAAIRRGPSVGGTIINGGAVTRNYPLAFPPYVANASLANTYPFTLVIERTDVVAAGAYDYTVVAFTESVPNLAHTITHRSLQIREH